MIVDAHAHTFPEKIAARAISKLEAASGMKAATDGTEQGLINAMKNSGTDCSIILPVCTNPDQADNIIRHAYELNCRTDETGIMSFGGIHPDNTNYRQILNSIKKYGIQGIKLHPEYQGVRFDDMRYMHIIDYASELGLAITVHSGIDIGFMDSLMCPPSQVLSVIKTVRPQKLILAHMGGYLLWDEVTDIIAGQEVYFDMSSCVGVQSGIPAMSMDKFIELIRLHGTDRIIYGTDSPWADQSKMIAIVKSLPFTDEEMEGFFSSNIKKLININM